MTDFDTFDELDRAMGALEMGLGGAASMAAGFDAELKRIHQTFASTGKGAAKKYIDWRQAFRDHVQRDFLKLWAINRDNEYFLTTTGKQAEMEMRA